MKNSRVRVIFILAAVCTASIVAIQAFWVQRAYSLEDKQFDLNVNIALRDVAYKVWEFKQSQASMYNIVKREGPDYFIVKINEHVDKEVLEHFLRESFSEKNILTDFVFGLHDCMLNKMEYQKYIHLSGSRDHHKEFVNFPKVNFENYYFAVYFPHRRNYIASQLTLWTFSSILIAGVLLFLAYVVYIILRQKRLSEIQKDFVNNMTHEFKTPLSSIQLASTVLKKPAIINNPAKLLNYATIIEAEAKKLQAQVERVLQIVHSNKKEIKLDMKPLPFIATFREVLNGFATLIEDRKAEVNLKCPNTEIWINADKDHIKTALNNLMDNALKYSPENPIINITIQERNNDVSLSIQDNGIGINKEHAKHIFERFYRVPMGNIHNVKGFGIGLNYVKSIVEAHKGKITCSSVPQKGSTFTIILPKYKSV